MKRKTYILLIILLLVLVIAISTKPIIIFVAKKQLADVFPESKISIGGCAIKAASQLSLFNIEIKKANIYNFKIKEARVSYNPLSLLRCKIKKFYLGDTSVSFVLPQKSITEFGSYFNLKPSIFFVSSMELGELKLDLKSKEMSLEGGVRLGVNLVGQVIDYLELKISSLEVQGLKLNKGFLAANQKSPGEFNIEKIQYDKAKIEGIRSKIRLEGKNLFLENLSAKAFDGELQGDLALTLDKEPQYLGHIKAINLDLEKFAQDFNLKEKFQMSGKLVGELAFKGSGANVQILDGNFSTVEPGGRLTITDDKFLKNVAQNSGQSLDILVESFKDYHYNNGVMKLSLEQGNLILDIALNGEAGKRNLNIVLHNFKFGKGGL